MIEGYRNHFDYMALIHIIQNIQNVMDFILKL